MRVRVGLGGVLVVPQQVGQAGLVPGEVLPAGVPVVDVPVGDDDAGEVRQDAEVAERFQGRGRPGGAASSRSVNAPSTYFLVPARPGPQRGLIEPGDPRRR